MQMMTRGTRHGDVRVSPVRMRASHGSRGPGSGRRGAFGADGRRARWPCTLPHGPAGQRRSRCRRVWWPGFPERTNWGNRGRLASCRTPFIPFGTQPPVPGLTAGRISLGVQRWRELQAVRLKGRRQGPGCARCGKSPVRASRVARPAPVSAARRAGGLLRGTPPQGSR
jgi:hypothetical protein